MSDELAGRYLDGLAAAVTVALRAQLDAGQVPAGPWPAPRMTVDDLPPGFGSLPESTGVAVLDYALAVLAAQWPHVEDEDEALERVASTRAAALAALDGRPILLPGDEAPPGWVEQCEKRLRAASSEPLPVAAAAGADIWGATLRLVELRTGEPPTPAQRETVGGWVSWALDGARGPALPRERVSRLLAGAG